jgi:hypothetical protein
VGGVLGKQSISFKDGLTLFFGYSSVIGLVITAVTGFYAAYRSYITAKSGAQTGELAVVIIILAIVCAVFAFVSIRAITRHDRLWREQDQIIFDAQRTAQAKLSKIFHNFAHEYRCLINEIHTDLTQKDYSAIGNREQSLKMFLLYMLSNIKEAFDIITDDECAACIKMIDNQEITTFMRDPVSYRSRDGAPSKYPYYENTAFKNILSNRRPDLYFLSNNLPSEKTYVNGNPHCNRDYLATLVVPIRLVLNKQGESQIIGFICVDNFKGNFTEKLSVDTLAVFADLSFPLFASFNLLKVRAAEAMA